MSRVHSAHCGRLYGQLARALNDLRFDYYRAAPTDQRHFADGALAAVLLDHGVGARASSSDAVKVLTHVKEWLEEEPTESREGDALKIDMSSRRCTSCGRCAKVGDAGVADWAALHQVCVAADAQGLFAQPPKVTAKFGCSEYGIAFSRRCANA